MDEQKRLCNAQPAEGCDLEVFTKVAETNSGSLPYPGKKPADPGDDVPHISSRETSPQTSIQKNETKKSSSDDQLKPPILVEDSSCSSTANINVEKIPTESQEKRRTFDQETREYLYENYKDWQNPKETIIVGEFPADKEGDPGSDAEGRIFHLLEEFGRNKKELMFVVHSFCFSELKTYVKSGVPVKERVNGEHDFVIIHRQYGVIFIQVKSKAMIAKAYEEAKKQLGKDQESLKIFLEEALDGEEEGQTRKTAGKMIFNCGFIAMPNCPKDCSSGRKGLFKEDCQDNDAFTYWWENNVANMKIEGFTQEIFKHLVIRFVGLARQISPCLQYRIDNTHKKIDKVTETKLNALLEFSCAVNWITGPAGSGKTWLMEKKVLELADPTINPGSGGILVLCRSEPFCQHLRERFKNYVCDDKTADKTDDKTADKTDDKTDDKTVTVHVLTYSQFLEDGIKANKDQSPKACYQHIFVDEAQDYVSKRTDWFQSIMDCLDNDTGRHYMWVMYDPNKCLQKFDNADVQLRVANASQLTTVVRNTEKIFTVFTRYYSAGDGRKLTQCGSVGLDVVWDNSLSDKSCKGDLVVKHVDKLVHENVKKSDICVLVEDFTKRTELEIQLLDKVSCQSAVQHIKQQKEAIIVDSIENFSSLESKVVILLDPPYSVEQESVKRLLYIGLSRSSSYLIVISTDDGCKAVKGNLEQEVNIVPPEV